MRTLSLIQAKEKPGREIAKRMEMERERDQIFSFSLDLLCIAGFDGYFRRLNPAWEKTLGYPVEELLGRPFLDFVHPDDRAATTAELERLAAGRKATYFENRYRCKDGSYKWLAWTGYPLAEKGLMYAVARDITEQKRAEELLREKTYDLGERVKELNCLYGISKLVEKERMSLEKVLSGVVDLIPPAWQYPEITCARLTLENREHRTENFREAASKQAAAIYVHRKQAGAVEVCYLEERPESDEGPFLKEERSLLNAIAGKLGRIVERNRAERALQESEKKYRDLVGNLQEGIWVIDRDACTTFVNQAMAEILGYSVDEMIGIPLFSFMDKNGVEIAKRKLDRRQRGFKEQHDFKFLHKDGTPVFVRLAASPIIDQDGDYIGAIAGVMDITEHRQMEEKLRESEEKFRLLCENAGQGIIHLDSQGTIIDANSMFYKITGWGKEEVLGKKLTELAPLLKVDNSTLYSIFQKIGSGAPAGKAELKIISKKGEELALLVYHSAIKRDEELIGFCLSVENITERKKMEEELYKAKSELEQRVKERTAELEGANDKREQVQKELLVYQGRLRSLASRSFMSEEQERRRIAQDLHDYTGQALALSKIKLGLLRSTVHSAELVESLEEIDTLLTRAIQYNRSLTFDLSPPVLHIQGLEAALQQLTEQFQAEHRLPITFECDNLPKLLDNNIQILLYRTVRELLFNAVKHAEADWLRVILRREGENLRITVEDNGVGFDPSTIDRPEAKIVGFGLFSIRERLNYFGGQVEIKSASGRGTRVSLKIPVSKE